jgi:hypothetical protein
LDLPPFVPTSPFSPEQWVPVDVGVRGEFDGPQCRPVCLADAAGDRGGADRAVEQRAHAGPGPGIGAGIVADSDPASEQRECEAKAGALLAAAREAITRAASPRFGQ